MIFPSLVPAPDRRLLDEGRRTRAMLWIMAIMLFLTVLAAALGLGMHHAGQALDRQLAGRLTVQIIQADPAARERQAAAVLAALKNTPGVRRAEAVDSAELTRLLEPWLGSDALANDLPIPAMIDVDLAPDARPEMVAAAARRVASDARVDRHARWLSPVSAFMRSLTWLAVALVLVLAAATAAVVLLAARTGLDTHRDTIDILHLLGSTDRQVARLFQRRIALDTLIGGLIGTIVATIVILLMAGQIRDLGSETLGGAALGRSDWLALLLLPLLFAGLAMGAARLSVSAALRRIL